MDYFYKNRVFHVNIKYEVLEKNENYVLLKDTSCSNHENCVVKVVPSEDGTNYLFAEAMNESAKRYSHYHEGTPYFDSLEKCKADYICRLKQNYDVRIKDINETIEKLQNEFDSLKPKRASFDSVADFTKDIYYKDENGELRQTKVKYVVKDANDEVAWWVSERGEKIASETCRVNYYDGKRFREKGVALLNIEVHYYGSYNEPRYEKHIAFTSRKDYDAYHNMMEACEIRKRLDSANYRLKEITELRSKLDE